MSDEEPVPFLAVCCFVGLISISVAAGIETSTSHGFLVFGAGIVCLGLYWKSEMKL